MENLGLYVDLDPYPDAAWAQIMFRLETTGQSDPYVFVTEPMMCLIPKTQTVGPTYIHGPTDPMSDQTSANTASGIAGQGAFATAGTISRTNIASYFNLNAFSLNYSITRSDGVTTVTESMAITSLGISAGFAYQGAGATANSLADLDPTAAGKLDTVTGASKSTVGYQEQLRRVLNPGGVLSYEAFVTRNPGSQAGYMNARVYVGPTGGTMSLVGTGSDAYVGPGEPGTSSLTGTYTNNTGVRQTFSIYVTDTITNGGNGPINQSQTYLLA